MSVRVQVNQDVDIAFGRRFVTCNRTEERSMQHPAIAEFRLVCAQRRYDTFTIPAS